MRKGYQGSIGRHRAASAAAPCCATGPVDSGKVDGLVGRRGPFCCEALTNSLQGSGFVLSLSRVGLGCVLCDVGQQEAPCRWIGPGRAETQLLGMIRPGPDPQHLGRLGIGRDRGRIELVRASLLPEHLATAQWTGRRAAGLRPAPGPERPHPEVFYHSPGSFGRTWGRSAAPPRRTPGAQVPCQAAPSCGGGRAAGDSEK